MEEEDTTAVMFLKNIQAIFADKERARIFSRHLVDDLIALEERPWFEWHKGNPMNQNSLAKVLKTLGIQSKTLRIGVLKRV